MTALVDGLGLLPAALSTRIGAQTQRPLAIVVIGGAISIALLTRVFQPTLMFLFHRYIGLIDSNERPDNGNPPLPPDTPVSPLAPSPANPFPT
jgi:cobalt-zinc-cadmium resistance protein CzcA